ncbi:MAG TPA: hypothetical protein VK572_12325 [Burkholderiales bacterium]|nr:hypothetical protein [Burkholderiales bacterium]
MPKGAAAPRSTFFTVARYAYVLIGATVMRWQFWFRRGKEASSAAKYAAEVLYASWIPPLPQTVVAQVAPPRAKDEVADIGAFLRRVYSNQGC